MSERISFVAAIIKTLPELYDGDLFISYAEKAIGIHNNLNQELIVNHESISMASISTTTSGYAPVCIITEDKQYEIRTVFRYKNVPRQKLAIDLLDLCRDSQATGMNNLKELY